VESTSVRSLTFRCYDARSQASPHLFFSFLIQTRSSSQFSSRSPSSSPSLPTSFCGLSSCELLFLSRFLPSSHSLLRLESTSLIRVFTLIFLLAAENTETLTTTCKGTLGTGLVIEGKDADRWTCSERILRARGQQDRSDRMACLLVGARRLLRSP